MPTILQRNLAENIVKNLKPNTKQLKKLCRQVVPSVYVLRCGKYYKIGYTMCLERRIDSILNGNPFGVKIVYIVRTEKYKELEKSLHAFFSDRNRIREWFELLPEDEQRFEDFVLSFLWKNN